MSYKLNNICVYCGSSPGTNPAYLDGATALARQLADSDVGLVYGGASIGVMGKIADQVLENGGCVTGVIPQSLVNLEIAHQGLTELIVTADMHERKATMAERADGFIAMPGGLGTLEELFEVLTWCQLGLHAKPIGVLNINGFYDGLLHFIGWQVEQGFVKSAHRSLLLADTEPAGLLSQFAEYQPVSAAKV